MRAGRLDLFVETGAAFSRIVEVVQPGDPVAASTLVAGQRYYLEGSAQRVHAVEPQGNGWTRVSLLDGLYGQPVLSIPNAALVAPAEPVVVADAAAAFTVVDELVDPDAEPKLVAVELPVEIAPDGLSVTLALDEVETALLAAFAGAHSWDLYVSTAERGWQRVLEGTLTIIVGDAR